MAGKRELKDRVASLLDLPGDVVLNAPRITLFGDSEVVIENHRGLCEYTAERVVLALPAGRVAVNGASLTIESVSPDQVIIRGQVVGLLYE
ncbi:MAG: sporulation protein YqfC [Mycobacterium leprae]